MLNHCGRFTQERRLQRGRNDLPRHKLWGSYQPDISPGPLTSAIHANVDEMGPTCIENGTFWRPPELALARPGPAGSCHLSLPHTLRSLWAPEPHCHAPRRTQRLVQQLREGFGCWGPQGTLVQGSGLAQSANEGSIAK